MSSQENAGFDNTGNANFQTDETNDYTPEEQDMIKKAQADQDERKR